MKKIRYGELFTLLIFKDFTWDKFLLLLRQRHPIELLLNIISISSLFVVYFSDFLPLQKVVLNKNNLVANLMFSL